MPTAPLFALFPLSRRTITYFTGWGATPPLWHSGRSLPYCPPRSGAGFPFMYRGGQGRERKRRKERGRRGYIGPLLKRQRLPLHKGRYNPAFRLRLGPLTRHTPNRRQHGVKPVFPHSSFPPTRSLASHWTQKIRWPHAGTGGRRRFNLFNWLSRKGRKKEPVL